MRPCRDWKTSIHLVLQVGVELGGAGRPTRHTPSVFHNPPLRGMADNVVLFPARPSVQISCLDLISLPSYRASSQAFLHVNNEDWIFCLAFGRRSRLARTEVQTQLSEASTMRFIIRVHSVSFVSALYARCFGYSTGFGLEGGATNGTATATGTA